MSTGGVQPAMAATLRSTSSGQRMPIMPTFTRESAITKRKLTVPSVLCLWEVRHFEAITGQVGVRGRPAQQCALVGGVTEQPAGLVRTTPVDPGWRDKSACDGHWQ
jgi:hypothetical protein